LFPLHTLFTRIKTKKKEKEKQTKKEIKRKKQSGGKTSVGEIREAFGIRSTQRNKRWGILRLKERRHRHRAAGGGSPALLLDYCVFKDQLVYNLMAAKLEDIKAQQVNEQTLRRLAMMDQAKPTTSQHARQHQQHTLHEVGHAVAHAMAPATLALAASEASTAIKQAAIPLPSAEVPEHSNPFDFDSIRFCRFLLIR
jgi:protease II